jgi:hypothetical protein
MPTTVLGPWSDGLNLVSNRESAAGLAPTELAEATNICYTIDGNIEPRPGFKIVRYPSMFPAGAKFTILGSVRLENNTSAVYVQRRYTGTTTVFQFLSVYNNANPPWGGTTIKSVLNLPSSSVEFTHCIGLDGGRTGHKGIVFFGKDDNTSYLNPDFTGSGTFSLISPTAAAGTACKIPGSDGGIVVKNRLFLWKKSTSRFMWSPAFFILDFSLLEDANVSGTDTAGYELIDPVHAGDGITAVEFANNNFYIFKRTKFFMWTYQANPTDDSYLRKISDEGGVIDSTLYRGNIVVLSNKGVFRLEGTEPIDLQSKLNLRFEFPLDSSFVTPDDAFITDFNDNILVGINKPKAAYYVMNGHTGAWSKWDFDYMDPGNPTGIKAAAPGGKAFVCQEQGSDTHHLMFTSFAHDRLVFAMHKPYVDLSAELQSYHYYLDTELMDVNSSNGFYIPSVSIKTKSNFGASLLRHKKIQRVYIRFYLSEAPLKSDVTYPNPIWSATVNFNDYRDDYDTEHDPAQHVAIYPMDPKLPFLPPTKKFTTPPTTGAATVLYQREYQLPFHQMRATEFTFSLKRAASRAIYVLNNQDSDRPAKEGYYFLLSAVWFDYLDKSGI